MQMTLLVTALVARVEQLIGCVCLCVNPDNYHHHHHTTTVLRPFFRDHPG